MRAAQFFCGRNSTPDRSRLQLRRAASVVAPALLVWWIHSSAYLIATVQNNHDYRIARFRETCGKPVTCAAASTPECTARCLILNDEEKTLHEAKAALDNGGGLPLQMKALKAADKAAK